MAECAHKTQMSPLTAKLNRQIKGHNSRTEKVTKSEIEIGLPFRVPDIVQIIFLGGTYVIEQIPSARTYRQADRYGWVIKRILSNNLEQSYSYYC